MTSELLSDCVEVHVPQPASRLISDSELAALPPSPHRDAELVARRAYLRQPFWVREWPFLISGAIGGAYLLAAAVIR